MTLIADLPSAPALETTSQTTPDMMQAAVFAAPGQISMETVPTPQPGAGELLIRMEGCGVCASNLPVWEGREWFTYPRAAGEPGHEGWGRVAALGEGVRGFEIGDPVAALSYRAYAEYDVAGAGNVVKLPPSLAGKPFPAEPLGCAINIFNRSGVQAGDTVAIVGIGFLGALLTEMAVNAGATVIAIARRETAQNTARQYGAQHIVPMDDHWRIIEDVKGLTNGAGCEVVIEAVGKQWPLDLAAELTRERGRLIIAGYHQDGPRQVNMQLWNWRGLDVINAHERDPQMYTDGMQAAVEAVAAGRMNPYPLFTHTYPLSDLTDGLRATAERPDGFMKALVIMGDSANTTAGAR